MRSVLFIHFLYLLTLYIIHNNCVTSIVIHTFCATQKGYRFSAIAFVSFVSVYFACFAFFASSALSVGFTGNRQKQRARIYSAIVKYSTF